MTCCGDAYESSISVRFLSSPKTNLSVRQMFSLVRGGEELDTGRNNDQYASAINQSRAVRVQLVNSLKRFPPSVIGQCETLSGKKLFFFISSPAGCSSFFCPRFPPLYSPRFPVNFCSTDYRVQPIWVVLGGWGERTAEISRDVFGPRHL